MTAFDFVSASCCYASRAVLDQLVSLGSHELGICARPIQPLIIYDIVN